MLVNNIFLFSNNVFKGFLLGQLNSGLCGKGLTYLLMLLLQVWYQIQNLELKHYSSALLKKKNPCFYVSAVSLLKNFQKRKNCLQRAFPPFPSVFCTLLDNFVIFIKFKIVVCKPFEFGRV